jgi:hypothetical protein
MRVLRDERGLVVSWLVRIFIGLALASIVIFDAGSIVVNHIGLQQAAEDMANALASEDFSLRPTVDMTEFQDEAERLAAESDAHLVKATVDSEGVVHVKLRRSADPTILVGRIDALNSWTRATAKAEAKTTP